jgi:hypothetical protein
MKITAKQVAFAEGILAGNTGSESYRRAYNTKGSNRAVARKAVALMAHSGVAGYISEMREARKTHDPQQAAERSRS